MFIKKKKKKTSNPSLIWLQLFGSAYLGPFGHYFYTLLDKIFKGKKDNKTVGKKVNLVLLLLLCYLSFQTQDFHLIDLRRRRAVFMMNLLYKLKSFQVLFEQLTSSPLNNLVFMLYYGLVIEGESGLVFHCFSFFREEVVSLLKLLCDQYLLARMRHGMRFLVSCKIIRISSWEQKKTLIRSVALMHVKPV